MNLVVIQRVFFLVVLLLNVNVMYDRVLTSHHHRPRSSSQQPRDFAEILNTKARPIEREDVHQELIERKIAGFYHLDARHEWEAVMKDQFEQLGRYGLLNETKHLFVGIRKDDWVFRLETIKAVLDSFGIASSATQLIASNDKVIGQALTLQALYAFCQSNPDYYAYYFYSLGSSTSRSTLKYETSKPRRDRTQYFLFERWLDIYELLSMDLVDAVGINYNCRPFSHYSDNFWWASCRMFQTHTPPRVRTSTVSTSLHGQPDRVYDDAWLMDLEEGTRLRIAECYHDEIDKKNSTTSSIAGLTCQHPLIIGVTDGTSLNGRCS